MATNSIKHFITSVVIPIVFVICILLSLPLVCGGHGHSHDHHGHSHGHHGHGHGHHGHGHGHAHGNEEAPAFKWSKQANDPYAVEEEEHHQDAQETAEAPPKSSVWFEAIVATLGISIAPYLILFFIPVTNSVEHQPYLKVLLAFASGGLLGDAFLHLIPHALMAQADMKDGGHAHSHSHSHSHNAGAEGGHGHDMTIGLAVLAGIIAFLVVEKFVRLFKGGHSHSHSHDVPVPEESKSKEKSEEGSKDETKTKSKDEKDDNKDDSETNTSEEPCTEVEATGDIKVAGYLNLAADFTHNLTDGLAIGASFLAGKNVGIVTTVTIFLHEIPHEIGDFAILLQSGCSRRKAMMLQLVTALGALTGTMISLLAEGADDSSIAWILPFTAGGFIYIATVSVIPELLESSRVWQSVFEIMALLGGVALMMGIAHLEEIGHEH